MKKAVLSTRPAFLFTRYQQEQDAPCCKVFRTRSFHIPEEISIIDTEEIIVDGAKVNRHELYTNGVSYADAALMFPFRKSWKYLPVLQGVVQHRIPGSLYDELATKLSLYTGFRHSSNEQGYRKGKGCFSYLSSHKNAS